uniref:Uncharacterized protein n=2 Tax=Clastoptera arizonana TaxID=38151 RepID=A0A1B6D5K8_9HEMI
MDEIKQPQYLSDEMLFKMVIISLMCLQHLKEKNCDQVTMMALMLAIMSQLTEKALQLIECLVAPRQPPLPSQINGISKRRRRRRMCKGSSVSSDLSEDEVEIINSDTDLSEEELVFDNQSDSDIDAEETEYGNSGDKNYSLCIFGEQPSLVKTPILTHIQHLCDQGFLLQTIKICCDWLVSNSEVLRISGPSSKKLIRRLVSFLNHLAPIPVNTVTDGSESDGNNKIYNEIPIEEDICTRGLTALKMSHSKLDWNRIRVKCFNPREQAYIRICKLVSLGEQLSNIEGSNIKYNTKVKWFESLVEEPNNENKSKEENIDSESSLSKGKLMQDMGQLWLRAEVRELETKVKRTAHLPPYLVLDCDALIHHIPLVKQLVSSHKFIVLIPSIVVSELDNQKRISHRVRDTIRWLETQFRHGNRFLRAQRSNEHLPLPLIKYPKKKDKEAWLYFQIVECCNYLSMCSVDNPEGNTDKNKDSLVTLLTGRRNLLSPTYANSFSPLGVAKSAGINVEHIETFHGKWKNSSKSHG